MVTNTESINDILGDGGLSSVVVAAQDASGATVLVGAGKQFNSSVVDNEVLLVGDSMTARHFHYHIASAGSVSGTDLTLTITAATAATGQAVTGSRCRVTGATSAALNTWTTVVSQNGTSLILRYTFDLTGLTPGTPTTWLPSLRGEGGYLNHVMALHRMQGINSNIIDVQGIGGDTFAKVIDRYATDVAPYLPCRVALFLGFNDAAAVEAASYTQATMLGYARTLIEQLLADGGQIDLISPIPFVSGAAGGAGASVAIPQAGR